MSNCDGQPDFGTSHASVEPRRAGVDRIGRAISESPEGTRSYASHAVDALSMVGLQTPTPWTPSKQVRGVLKRSL